jgi:hypothetical protein
MLDEEIPASKATTSDNAPNLTVAITPRKMVIGDYGVLTELVGRQAQF